MKRTISIIIIVCLVLLGSVSLADSLPSVGDIVSFGCYPQSASGNDSTPIEWIVLDTDSDNNALLLSKCVLDCQPFHTDSPELEWRDATWGTCSLRIWLNTDFMNTAFNVDEQQHIVLTTLDNTKQVSAYKGTAENDTEDKVFLLSAVEAAYYLDVKHFSVAGSKENKKSRAYATDYALGKGVDTSSSQKTSDGHRSSYWILRTNDGSAVYDVFYNGAFSNAFFKFQDCPIRPAIWVHY